MNDLECLYDYGWEDAFGFADNFTQEDVKRIIAIEEGCNDGPDWIGLFELNDGRFASLRAGCDYTGWDCQAWGCSDISDTLSEAITMLSDEERYRLSDQLQ